MGFNKNLDVQEFQLKFLLSNVYSSICFFSKKTINMFLKLEICVACREFFAFKYVVIVFFRNKTDENSYLYIRNLENSSLKLVHKIHLYLCWQVDDTKWILCCLKLGVKCECLRFLMYKYYFLIGF